MKRFIKLILINAIAFLPFFSLFSNSLNKIELFQEKLPLNSTHFLLVFSQPCEFSIINDHKNTCFSLIFKNANDFFNDKEALRAKIQQSSPLIRDIQISTKNQNVEVTFFCKNDRIYVRCYPLENKSRYQVEVYSIDALEKLKNQSSEQLLHAFAITPPDLKKKIQKCIVLDSGHGGESKGAQGLFGLLEKNLTLDVTKKVKTLLEHKGYSVVLTRDRDCDKTLLERSEIAAASGGDLFVSIHANSSGGAPEPYGIETFHVNGSSLCLADNAEHDYVFNNNQLRMPLRKLTNSLAKSKETYSHNLADSIQNQILTVLEQHQLKPLNRGVKKALFNVLLRGRIPSALVEIGFLTNEHEARLLAQEPYKNLIAQGISNGIDQFCKKIKSQHEKVP